MLSYLLINGFESGLLYAIAVLFWSLLIEPCDQVFLRLTFPQEHDLLEDVDYLLEIVMRDIWKDPLSYAVLEELDIFLHDLVVVLLEGEVLVALVDIFSLLQVKLRLLKDVLVFELRIDSIILVCGSIWERWDWRCLLSC